MIALIEDIRSKGRRCPDCACERCHRHGQANDLQRFRCCACGRTFNDLTGTPLAQSFEALREHGRLVFVGNVGGSLSPDLFPAMGKNLTLHGVFFGALWERPEVSATIEASLADVAAGKLEVVIDRRFPLAEAAAAHRHAEGGGILGRTVMVP